MTKIDCSLRPLLLALLMALAWEEPGCGRDANERTDAGAMDVGSPIDTRASAASNLENCRPILTSGQDTGFDDCNGETIRRAAIACPESNIIANPVPCAAPADDSCATDADCTAQPLGYCAGAHNLGGVCGCVYGCRKDSDCATGSICECGGPIGTCFPADCTSGASCGSGLACIYTHTRSNAETCSPRMNGYYCQTSSDECTTDGDCPSSLGCYLVGSHRVCGMVCI